MEHKNNQKKESNVVTLRIPKELKYKLARHAKFQGVSINQLAIYLLNSDLTQLGQIASLETRLDRGTISILRKKVQRILIKIPDRNVPIWDRL